MSLKVIHFKSIFLIDFYLKRLIYVQKYGITHQTAIQQEIQEKEEFLQKKEQKVDERYRYNWLKKLCSMRGAQGLKDLML